MCVCVCVCVCLLCLCYITPAGNTKFVPLFVLRILFILLSKNPC